MSIAQRGFAVVNFTYRLAPEYQFPAPMEDTNSVFAWILDNKDKYGMDVANLFAVGDSAGGQILSLYADICTNAEYAKEYDFPGTGRTEDKGCGIKLRISITWKTQVI